VKIKMLAMVDVTYECPNCHEYITVDQWIPSINVDEDFVHECFLCGSNNWVLIETRAEIYEESNSE
jgi:hypothetical protein